MGGLVFLGVIIFGVLWCRRVARQAENSKKPGSTTAGYVSSAGHEGEESSPQMEAEPESESLDDVDGESEVSL